MKRSLNSFICILISLALASCSSTHPTENKSDVLTIANDTTSSSISESMVNKSLENQANKQLLSRIEALENEVALLKEELQSYADMDEKQNAIFNALDNDNGDNIFIGLDREDGYLNAVHVKVPNGDDLNYNFYIYKGYEIDGIPILNNLFNPTYDYSSNPQKIDYDPDKFTLYRLITPKLKYDETSVLLIIAIDKYGNEYSQLLNSERASGDI